MLPVTRRVSHVTAAAVKAGHSPLADQDPAEL
jgi:hypothetical protein